MKTITVRDLRQRWPAAESLLETERELLVTRDGQPIARLVRLAANPAKRRRFDPAAHRAWQRQVFGRGATVRWADRALATGRGERDFGARA
jgi:antitoxin (DNA-binding transcriptional repressor) of toxin-antitoxin stability system